MQEQLESIVKDLKDWGNINSASRVLVKRLCLLTNWSYGEFWLPDNSGVYMTWNGCWAKFEENYESFSRFSSMHKFAKGIGLIGKIWEQEKILISEKILEDTSFLRSEIASQISLNTVIGLPIINKEKVLMILCFFKHNLTNEDIEAANEIFSYSSQIGEILVTL